MMSMQERDLERMQDVERVEHAQTSRHQLELMFRSSHMNEDRAAVLQFNNPIPDLNNRHGGESVARYLPSWTEQTPEDVRLSSQYCRQLLAHRSTTDVDLFGRTMLSRS